LDLYRILASSCRTKILLVLYQNRHIHVMELVRKVNSTYNQFNSHIQVLQKEGIVTDERLGRQRFVKLKRESPKTLLLLEALRILKAVEDRQVGKGIDYPSCGTESF
jgi:DNA-binding transcriptional ArsR family regulator